jgi:hypothetical protein
VLIRLDEPPAVLYSTRAPALSVEEEKALARRVFQPYAQGNDADKYRCLTNAATIDPLAVLESLNTFKFSDADYENFARVFLAETLARKNLDEAMALIEASANAHTRAQGYVGICDVKLDLTSDRVKELLAQATLNARSVKSPTDRLALNARIADHWLDLGQTKRARALLDEGLELGKNTAKGIKNGGYNLGLVAEPLARIDLPATLTVLDDVAHDVRKNEKRDRSYVFDRFHGMIAYKLAVQSPADAERVLPRQLRKRWVPESAWQQRTIRTWP